MFNWFKTASFSLRQASLQRTNFTHQTDIIIIIILAYFLTFFFEAFSNNMDLLHIQQLFSMTCPLHLLQSTFALPFLHAMAFASQFWGLFSSPRQNLQSVLRAKQNLCDLLCIFSLVFSIKVLSLLWSLMKKHMQFHKQ